MVQTDQSQDDFQILNFLTSVNERNNDVVYCLDLLLKVLTHAGLTPVSLH